MRIKEIANYAGVKESVLRFYEEKELLHPKRDENGYRQYQEEDLHRVMLIVLYRRMGFSIAHIRELFQQDDESQIAMFFQQQAALNHQIEEMKIIREGISSCLDQALMNQGQQEVFDILRKSEQQLQALDGWEDRWNFDAWAKDYDHTVQQGNRKGLPFYQHYDRILDRCAELIHQQIGHVLEIGIGTGNLAHRIALKQPVTGIDQSLEMLMMTKRKFPEIPVRMGTFLHIPFADQTFSCVVSSYAFHHNDDTQKIQAIHEMDRVLQTGGRMVLCDLMFETAQQRKLYEQRCSEDERADLKDEYFANVDEITIYLQTLNYTVTCEQQDELIWIIYAKKGYHEEQ